MRSSLLKTPRKGHSVRIIAVAVLALILAWSSALQSTPSDSIFPNDGAVYEGDEVAGAAAGKGIQRWADGRRYEGDFKAGQRHGLGALILRDGTRFQGQFQNDLMEGFILRENPDGMREIQQWTAGELINAWPLRETPDCRLSLDNVLWMFVGGRCMDGLAHGAGLAARLDGSAVIPDGRFVLGRLVSGSRVPLVDDAQ
jgi:hypothetical protein